MSTKVTRREFIISSGTGLAYALISPLFARQAVDLWDNENKPLLIPPANPQRILAAIDSPDGYILYEGGEPDRIPEITWREYLEDYLSVDPENPKEFSRFLDHYGYDADSVVLDDPCPEDEYAESWCLHNSPNAEAYFYLQRLRLGRSTSSGKWDSIGGISFQDCPSIGSSFRGVIAEDQLSLAALQERLNQLGENTLIRIG